MAAVAIGTIRVFIAEDKDVVRISLGQLVQQLPDAELVGMAVDGESAFKQILELNPTVALIKENLPLRDGLELTRQIKLERPNVAVVLMLSSVDEFWHGLKAKADGYFFRDASADALEPAIRTVAEGGAYISKELSDYLIRGEGYDILRQVVPKRPISSVTASLSMREKEVLGLLSDGKSNERIAQDLGLSIQTVKVHVKHILKKMNVSDRTQAVIKALTAR